MQDKLMEGKEYHLWRGSEYLGIDKYNRMRDIKHNVTVGGFDIEDLFIYYWCITNYQQASELTTI
jgi:hypothetical protein